MSNIVRYPDLNHRYWSKSYRYLARRRSTRSPTGSIADVMTFRLRRATGFCYCYDAIAQTALNKSYTYSIWVKTAVRGFTIQAYRVNYTNRTQRTRYTYATAKSVPNDNRWHQVTWRFNNTSTIRGKSLSFRLKGLRGATYSLYQPKIVLINESTGGNTGGSSGNTGGSSGNTGGSSGNTGGSSGNTGGSSGNTGGSSGNTGGSSGTSITSSSSTTSSSSVSSFADVYKAKIDCVVNIMMQAVNNNLYSGTGFFISADGLIATAAHVVTHGSASPEPYATKVWIHYYPENRTIEGRVLGVDRLYDVALIKVNLPNRKYLEFYDSRNVKIGSPAVAIGQPMGNHVQSITGGIVRENKGQDYSWMAESLIVDFDIIGGNSGGPVMNLDGKVIGIVSWGLTEGAFALNGAISSHCALKVIDYIKGQNGNVPHDYPSSYIGVSFTPIDMYHTISRKIVRVEGVLVNSVAAGSPAHNAGLRGGDIITHCNNKVVGKNNNQEPLGTLLHFATIGTNMTLRVLKAPSFATRTIAVRTIRLPGMYDYIFSNKFNIDKLNNGKHTICT